MIAIYPAVVDRRLANHKPDDKKITQPIRLLKYETTAVSDGRPAEATHADVNMLSEKLQIAWYSLRRLNHAGELWRAISDEAVSDRNLVKMIEK